MKNNICEDCGGDIITEELIGRGLPPKNTKSHPLIPKLCRISYKAIWIKSVCQKCNKTSTRLKDEK